MSVTEHLMRPGTFKARFVPDVPVNITNQIVDAMEGAGGAGCHFVVTPSRVHTDGVPVAAILATASYTGRITKRPSRLSVEGVGILNWLSTYSSIVQAETAGTPTDWVGTLVTNGVTAGTVTNTGASTVTRSFPPWIATRREMLDTVASAGGWEYVMQPDFTIDAAITGTLFDSHDDPELVVTRREEGDDGALRGVDGGILDQALDDSQLTTQIAVLAEGDGASIAVGTDSQTVTLKTWDGSTPNIQNVVSSPATPDADADGIATSVLNLRTARREVSVSSTTYALHRFASPGDYIYLWDPASGLYDLGNNVQFRGDTISPVKVRLLSWTWPLETGLGVYLLLNGTTQTLVDLSDWIDYETGATFWTVGDWNPPRYGQVNRTNPEVEERVADTGWNDFSPTWNNISATSTDGAWRYADGGIWIKVTLRPSGAATGTISFDMPNSLTSRNDGLVSWGVARFLDDNTTPFNDETGTAICAPNATTVEFRAQNGQTVNATTPFTWASADRIDAQIFVSL